MAVRGSEILSYGGDANSGLASNAGALSVAGETQAEAISQTARELALQSLAVNRDKWHQKIQDRDAVYKMLDDDELILDKVLDQDRPMLEEKKKAIYDIWNKYNGDIYSDPKRFREFQGAIAESKQFTKQSQKRYVWLEGELKEKAEKAASPVDQIKRDRHIAQELQKDFWSLPNPYAPVTHHDLGIVAAKPVMGAPSTERKGDIDVVTTKVDPEKTFSDYQKKWSTPEFNHMFKQYVFGDDDGTYGGFLGGPYADADIRRVNDALVAVNAKLGRQPGQPGYIAPLGVKKDPITSKWMATTDRPDQIAAKIALADNPAETVAETFNKQRADIRIDEDQLDETRRANKAQEGLAAARNAESRRYHDALINKGKEQTKDPVIKEAVNQWSFFKDKMTTKPAPGLMIADGKFRILAKDVPIGYRNLGGVTSIAKGKEAVAPLQPIPGKDSKGGNVGDFYEVEFSRRGGEKVDPLMLVDMYKNDKAGGYTKAGTYDQYVKELIDAGHIDFEILGAKQQRATFGSALHSARFISNKAGSGKEVPVMADTNPDDE